MRTLISSIIVIIAVVSLCCIWYNRGYEDAVKYINDNYPSALDVYQGKTTLQYTIVDGVKVDSVVVFKND